MRTQGKAIAEQQPDGSWLLLLPDGEVQAHTTKLRAQNACRRWARAEAEEHVAARAHALMIEWRFA